MQLLTAPPRDAYTTAQIAALLVAGDLEVDFGAEVLDASLAYVGDLTPDLSDAKVSRDMLADIHGTCELTISRELAWGRDRVRLFMLVSSLTCGLVWVRFNLGVFLCTTPVLPLGEDPPTFVVSGFDQVMLLQGNIGDSYAVAGGANVLAAVRAAITAAGVVAPVLLDSTASTKTLVTAMTWPQTSSDNPTWLGVINDLLAAVGYRGVWCDQDGAFRSGPYVLPADRPSEWRLDVGNMDTGIVADARTVTADVWGAPNSWKFVMNGLDASPVNGVSSYSPTNPDVGASSIASLGRVVQGPVQYLDAVDFASLQVQGDRIKAAAMRVTEVLTLKMSPFPAAWHSDRYTYSDAALGADREVVCRSWSLPLTGEDMDVTVETVS